MTYLPFAVRVVRETSGALITAEGSMNTDPESSEPTAKPASKHTLIAF